jgi:hypothetical protein
MKKVFAIMVAVAALVAFTAPAWAAMDEPGPSFVVGGRMLTDVGYNKSSKELTNNKKEDVTTAFVSLAGHSYLNAKFASADKTTGGFIELGLLSTSNANSAGFKAANSESVLLRYAYGWWKVGNCKLLAGQDDGWVGSLKHAPKQYFGIDQDGKLLLANWGYIYSGRHPQVRFEWESGMFGFALAAVQPGAESLAYNAAGATGLTAGTLNTIPGVDAYANLPRFDAAVEFKAGGLWVQPGFAWSQLKLEGVSGGADNTSTQYMAILPVKFSVGPFTAKAEIHYGQNNDIEWSGNLLGLNVLRTALASVPVVKSNGKIEDSHQVGGFLALEYKIIPALEVTAGAGIEQVSNDAWKQSVASGGAGFKDDNYTRKAYFVALPYTVTKNFSLHPEFSYFDYGDNPQTNSDRGNEWLLGMQFRFVF